MSIPTRQKLSTRKHVQSLLRSQSIEVSDVFLTEPTKKEVMPCLREFVRVVLAYSINIQSQNQLKLFVAEHLKNCRPGSLTVETLRAIDDLDLDCFLPNQGERHIASVDIMALFRCLQQLGSICGVENITLEDILQPTASRMLMYAAAVADFLTFQENHMLDVYVKWNKICEDRRTILRLKDETQLILENLEASANVIEKQRQKLQDYVKLEKEESDRLKQSALNVRQYRENINDEEIRGRKAEEQLKTADETTNSLQYELSSLFNQIVESPRRITETLKCTEHQISELESTIGNLNSQIPILQFKHDAYKHFVPQCDAALDRLKESEMSYVQIKKTSQAIKKLEVEIQSLESQCEHINEESTILKSKLDDSSSILKALTEEVDLAEKAHIKSIEQRKAQIQEEDRIAERRQRNLKSMQNQINLYENEIENIELEMCNMKQTNSNFYANMSTLISETDQEMSHVLEKHMKDFSQELKLYNRELEDECARARGAENFNFISLHDTAGQILSQSDELKIVKNDRV